MEKFDLTTKTGKTKAFTQMSLFGLATLALDKLVSSKDQGEIAKELIRKGKEDGVKEMEITLNNDKGFDFGVPVEGIDIKAKAGSNKKIHIKVVYKGQSHTCIIYRPRIVPSILRLFGCT